MCTNTSTLGFVKCVLQTELKSSNYGKHFPGIIYIPRMSSTYYNIQVFIVMHWLLGLNRELQICGLEILLSEAEWFRHFERQNPRSDK